MQLELYFLANQVAYAIHLNWQYQNLMRGDMIVDYTPCLKNTVNALVYVDEAVTDHDLTL